MAKEDDVMAIMETLAIATDKDVGEVIAARGHWTSGQSARVNAGKALKKLSELGRVTRGDGFWKLAECRSEFKSHSRALTRALVAVLKLEGRYEG